MNARESIQQRFALYFEPEGYSLSGNILGRQSAGAGLVQGIAANRPKVVWCYSSQRNSAVAFARAIAEAGSPRTGVEWISSADPQSLTAVELLYRPDPMLSVGAWRRLSRGHQNAYSLCGITHTTASHAVMEAFASLTTTPLEEWDAIICTSRAVRESVQTIIESSEEFLRERVGATHFSLPQLPIIPLGVDCRRMMTSSDERSAARRALGLGPEDIAVLYVGRLSFHAKAHPVPMYRALEECSDASKVVLLQAGWFANDAIESAFKSDAAKLCPSVRTIFLDGRQADALKRAWAAADIFTSLSDNIQETFGLTPLEAMAAGLPVVVSDWDGYRDTVRHGIDGFCIPTVTLPAGQGSDLADRYDLGIDTYDHYCYNASQLVAVDVDATAAAFRQLIESRDLRERMGNAGRQRAVALYDWSVIFRRYLELWAELGARRKNAQSQNPPTARRSPGRPDPFSVFACYPTSVIASTMEFRRRAIAKEDAVSLLLLATVKGARVLPSQDLISDVVAVFPPAGWVSYAQILRHCGQPPRDIARALVWLIKMGALQHRTPASGIEDPGLAVQAPA